MHYDTHNILSQRNVSSWPEWHFNIGGDDSAIRIAAKFHRAFKKLENPRSIRNEIAIIEKSLLEFMPENASWESIRVCFKQARENNDPKLVIKAYTMDKEFSRRLNTHSAANTHHSLKLYCTLLNCPILAQTQEYTEAIDSILYHPELDGFLVQEETVYRGVAPNDEKLLASYTEGTTIITTTYLSTSRRQDVAELFGAVDSEDSFSILYMFNIRKACRRTALSVSSFSNFPDEEEVLILRYVPFKIISIERSNDGRKTRIRLDECTDEEAPSSTSLGSGVSFINVNENPADRYRLELHRERSVNSSIKQSLK